MVQPCSGAFNGRGQMQSKEVFEFFCSEEIKANVKVNI